jgi:hypothetical protein
MTTAQAKPDAELCLYIPRDAFNIESGCGRTSASYQIRFSMRGKDSAPVGISTYDDKTAGFDGLCIAGYCFENTTSATFELRYQDVYAMNSHELTRRCKVITTLERKLDKLSESEGYVQSLAEYLVRVARASGVKHVLRFNTTAAEWQAESVASARSTLAHLERQAFEKINPIAA